MGKPIDIDTVETGDRVTMSKSGTVIHVHSNGRLDIKWDGSGAHNSVNVELLTLEEDDA